jgi:hypothetical protein
MHRAIHYAYKSLFVYELNSILFWGLILVKRRIFIVF